MVPCGVLPSLLFALSLLSSCRTIADVASSPGEARSHLALRTHALRGDTMAVELMLGVGPTTTLTSMGATVQAASGWQFHACHAEQGAPLLACGNTPDGVHMAASWATGAHTGSLVTFLFVRTTPAAAAQWTLNVTQVHGARGQSLVDSLEWRGNGVP